MGFACDGIHGYAWKWALDFKTWHEERAERVPTCGQIDDVDKCVPALHHVDCHMGETAVVLHEGGHRGHRLYHLMHQNELLSVL